jgi:hypothetical protein
MPELVYVYTSPNTSHEMKEKKKPKTETDKPVDFYGRKSNPTEIKPGTSYFPNREKNIPRLPLFFLHLSNSYILLHSMENGKAK